MDYEFYGVTQDPQTKNYMLVLNDKCKKCIQKCNSMYFQQNFKNWTSGNNDIDKFIQDIQLSVHNIYDLNEVLEWIPYNKLNIKYIVRSRYIANWIDGKIINWNNNDQNWERGQNMMVQLERLDNPINIDIASEFISEVK